MNRVYLFAPKRSEKAVDSQPKIAYNKTKKVFAEKREQAWQRFTPSGASTAPSIARSPQTSSPIKSLSPSARSPTSKNATPGDFERLYPHLAEIVAQPDHILQSRKPNTALILKEISTDNQQLKLVLRLATRADQHGYKNSIITFMKIDRKEWDRLLRNKTILYSRRPI